MIVARQHQDAAVLGAAGVVGVAEDVAGAVDARTLAVPDAEHAVVLAVAAKLRLLRAPERCGGQVLVEARIENDVALADHRSRAQERAFQSGDRRAAIAGGITRGVEPGAPVALVLHQHQAHDGLRSGQELMRLLEIELVDQARTAFRHRALSSASWSRHPRRLSPTRSRAVLLVRSATLTYLDLEV